MLVGLHCMQDLLEVRHGALQQPISTTSSTAAGIVTTSTPGGTLAAGFVDISKLSSLTAFVANPAFTLNIKGQNANTNVLANPRIRVKNREKAKIHIGEKLPVFTTTSTANVGVSASVTYLDVGLKLDVEPNVTLDDDVSIKIGLEVSSIAKEVPGPSNSLAYQIGTRSASTVLRLKNGETQVLAGLISDEERKSTSHLPGLGEIPVLGRAFGSQRDTSIKTEIILLITPRVVRNILRPDFAQPVLPSGTEASVGAKSLTVKTQGPKSLGVSPRGSASAAPVGPASVAVSERALADTGEQTPAVAEGTLLSGPAEAAGGSEIEIIVATPGQGAPVQVDIAYDPTLFEAKLPAASSSGRVSLRVDQGRGSLRLRVLPGAKGETKVDVISAALEGGETIGGVAGSHAMKLNSP